MAIGINDASDNASGPRDGDDDSDEEVESSVAPMANTLAAWGRVEADAGAGGGDALAAGG